MMSIKNWLCAASTVILAIVIAVVLSSWSAAADIYLYIGEGGEPLYTNTGVAGSVKIRFPLAPQNQLNVKRAAHMKTDHVFYEPAIIQAGEQYSVDTDLIRSMIKVESNYNHHAVSSKGALGLMQLMPGTAKELGVSDPFDPEANIQGGVLHLRRMLDFLGGDLSLSLAAYNAGLRKVIAGKNIFAIAETRNYVRQVMENYRQMKAVMK